MTQAQGPGLVEQVIAASEARVNITWNGSNGDLEATVNRDATDGDIKQWVAEAIRSGSVPGIPADPAVDLTDFVIDRFGPTEARPYALLVTRPKVPFGARP